MNKERGKPSPKEVKPSPKHYWIKFTDVTLEDINALLGAYKDVTGDSPLPLDRVDFKNFRKEITVGLGYWEYPIRGDSAMDVIRTIGTTGELFVRFRIIIDPNLRSDVTRYRRDKDKVAMQRGIDNHFFSMKKAVPHSQI